MNVWVVSREYAGIAEAGGVKNVSRSLSESLAALGHKVTLFIPLYGCTDLSPVADYRCFWHTPVTVHVSGRAYTVAFCHGNSGEVEIVFVSAPFFYEKKAVYTYTKNEELEDSSHKQGSGHEDALFMNTVFQKAVIAYGETCTENEAPSIIHCQDATAAMVPTFMSYRMQVNKQSQAFFSKTKCVVTIHNAGPGYHHSFPSLSVAQWYTELPAYILQQGMNGGQVEPFLLASKNASITTVSPQYAKEILSGTTDTAGLSEAFAKSGTSIEGITNGIDVGRYNPADTSASLLPYSFNPELKDQKGKMKCREAFLKEYASKGGRGHYSNEVERFGYIDDKNDTDTSKVYIAYHGRVVAQKGISVLAKAAGMILSKKLPVCFVLIGQGQPELENELIDLTVNYPGKCVYFRGYDRFLSRLCVAIADFAVFPSHFEPCGLEDLTAQIFGTLPVAHATGGLCKIQDDETGFLYEGNTPEHLAELLEPLIRLASCDRDLFSAMTAYTACYARETGSWENVAKKYESLYKSILKKN